MSELLDEQYLTWLYASVSSVDGTNPLRTHWSLMHQLYTREFVWFVPNDDNRVQDGRDLRREFLYDQHIRTVEVEWMQVGCSVLELFIVLARMLAFESEGDPRKWFWVLLDNIGLGKFNDARYTKQPSIKLVDEKVDCLLQRSYRSDGSHGGLFPLKYPQEDQRKVELWYQMAAYINEFDW